jgi:crotonobetainyl-CoA:carnitine CoA-transferase CaiB-like acyl-CoA transferase
VQVNLLSSLLASLVNQGAGYINGAGVPAAMGNQHPSIAPYETLTTADSPLAVAVGNDRQFATMAVALGRPDLAADPRFTSNNNRVLNRATLVSELESALAARTAAEWTTVLQARGVPCGPVNRIDDAIALATRLGLDPVVQLATGDDQIATLANPIGLSRSRVRYHRAPPNLGADNHEIRAWLEDDCAATLTD